jgi:hypothetical protein
MRHVNERRIMSQLESIKERCERVNELAQSTEQRAKSSQLYALCSYLLALCSSQWNFRVREVKCLGEGFEIFFEADHLAVLFFHLARLIPNNKDL